MTETIPRAVRFLPALAALAVAWISLFPISSVDAYYHLATGKRILEEGAIPDRGVGSATFGSAPWHDNEWGFQVIAATIGRTERDASGVVVLTPAGRAGLIVLRALAVLATMSLLSAQMARAGVRPVLRALAVLLAAFLTFGNLFWDVRPQIFSYLGFAAIGYLLERARSGGTWPLVAALGVVVAWANVHGAFLLGVALIGCEAAGAWAEAFRRDGTRAHAARLTAVFAAAPMVACVNPLGWKQVVHPFLYMARPEIYAGNNEWSRPDLLHLPLLGLTALALAGAVAAGARPRLGLAVRAVAFCGLFFSAIRHLPFAALAIVPVLAVSLTDASRRRPILDPGSFAWGGALRRIGGTAAVVAVIVGVSGAKFVSVWPHFAEKPSRPLPEREARYLARARVGGVGFNGYRFGGFLMLRLYPDECVFMDGRNDLYGTFRTRVYLPILTTSEGWESLWREATARFDVRWALIDETDGLASALASDPGWRRVSEADMGVEGAAADGIVLFVRTAR